MQSVFKIVMVCFNTSETKFCIIQEPK